MDWDKTDKICEWCKSNHIMFEALPCQLRYLLFLIVTYMQSTEIEKSRTHILIETIEYVPNSVVTKTLIRKATGNVYVIAVDTGESLPEKISPFDTFIQVIEGSSEVVIDETSNMLKTGEGIIIPAHTSYNVKAKGRFKMISTIIKSGYEAISI